MSENILLFHYVCQQTFPLSKMHRSQKLKFLIVQNIWDIFSGKDECAPIFSNTYRSASFKEH